MIQSIFCNITLKVFVKTFFSNSFSEIWMIVDLLILPAYQLHQYSKYRLELNVFSFNIFHFTSQINAVHTFYFATFAESLVNLFCILMISTDEKITDVRKLIYSNTIFLNL
jgi:hypothetical protein